MTLNLLNVLYVLIALAMTILILLQRGAGAQAGSGFGAGASATVFGARGAASFLTRTTAVLAMLFFAFSLGMGWFISHRSAAPAEPSLGVMRGVADATDTAQSAGADEVEVPAAVAPREPSAADVPSAPPAEPAQSGVEEQSRDQR